MGDIEAHKARGMFLDNLDKVLEFAKGVKIVAVSKTKSIDEMKEAEEALKKRNLPVIFGENYANELIKKANFFPEAQFHFIGSLQSNKIKNLIEANAFIQTLSSIKHINIAKTLTNSGFIQVNVNNDPKKSGITIEEAKELLDKDFSPFRITGLMTILEENADEGRIREGYRKLSKLGEGKLELSMGMSHDYRIAIEEGATIIRLGSVLFGARS